MEALLARLEAEDEPEPPPDGIAIYPPIYRLKVTLKGIRPHIWRRVLVPSNVTLARLHRILQNVMGWQNYHLYSFAIDDDEYSEREGRYDIFLEARGRRLFELDLIAGSRFTYGYDFGDGWEHEVLLEHVFAADPAALYPDCLAGARACPPEDCGGPLGYADLLTVLADPGHEQHKALREWAGGSFDPEEFDIQLPNLNLLRTRPRETQSQRDRTLAWRAMQQVDSAKSRQRRE